MPEVSDAIGNFYRTKVLLSVSISCGVRPTVEQVRSILESYVEERFDSVPVIEFFPGWLWVFVIELEACVLEGRDTGSPADGTASKAAVVRVA